MKLIVHKLKGTQEQAAGWNVVLRRLFPKLAVCPGKHKRNNHCYGLCKRQITKIFFSFDVLLLGIYLKGLTTTAARAGKRDGPFWMECMSKTLSPAWRRLPSS